MTNSQLNCYCDKQVTAKTPFFLNEAGETNIKCRGDFITIAKVRMNSASPRQQLLPQSILFMCTEYISVNTGIMKPMVYILYTVITYTVCAFLIQ